MSRPLRVLHVIPSIGPARGGPSVVIRTMARCQTERGLEVHVATTDDNGLDRIAPLESVPMKQDSVTFWIFRRQTRFYTFSFPLTRWLWKRTAEYDLVHIHALFSYPSVAAAICAKFAGVPYIVRPLGTLSHWGMRNRRPWLKRLSFRFIESFILKGSAGVHYTSEQEALEARDWGVRGNSLVIPNPVDLPENVRGRRTLAARMVVLFLSRLDPKKGLDLLLPAFARVRACNPQAVLMIAGDGDSEFVDGLKQQALRLGLGQYVSWTGFLRGEEKRDAFADAGIFVLPSYSENFGVAVVEAMGAGLPVIVSDQVGIHREVAKADAGLVVECSVESLESALTRALGDEQLRARMGANASALARQFSPEIVAKQLIDAYARICDNHGEPVAA